MNSFNEIRNEYKRFQTEFSNNIHDKFGSSINHEGLELISHHLEALVIHESMIISKSAEINTILLEARTILPDLGV